MDTKIEIRTLKISDIKPNPKNPKKHWVEKISESIREMGYIEPIVTDENNMILVGHGRLKALKDNETKEIEVIIKRGLTEEQKEKYILLSNKLVEAGGWDLDLLKEFDLNLLIEAGFNDIDLKNIWDDVLEIEDDDFNEQQELEKIKTTDIKIGDMFQLGNHKLLCMDSVVPENIKKLMGQEKTSFIYCDPPYNISLDYDKGIGGKSRYGGKTNDHKTNAEYKNFLRKTISNALDVGSDDLHIFYYCDQKYVGLIQELYTSLGIKNQRICLWIKNGFNVTPQIAFNKCYEPCIYGTIGKPHLSPINNLNEILNREIGTGNRAIDDILDILDIWLAKRLPGQDYEHATSKPPTLHEKALRRCTKINDIVLDLFGGSGSTLIACDQLKRRAYLMEYEPIFCQLIINRFEKITGIKAKLIK